MLPSKGYFSLMPCPYYDSGDCIRPHCHFRHSKKDRSTDEGSPISPSSEFDQTEDSSKFKIITEAIKDAVQKALGNQEDNDQLTDVIVNNVVNSIEPTLESTKKDFANVPSYKPTPISELNKRHIPVVYAPTKPIPVDRAKKRELKESLTYSPKSITKNVFSEAYVPSSQTKSDGYLPSISSSYTYNPSPINTNVSAPVVDRNEVEADEKEEQLKALDKLIDEEFGSPHYSPNSSGFLSDLDKKNTLEKSDNENSKELMYNLSGNKHGNNSAPATSKENESTSDSSKTEKTDATIKHDENEKSKKHIELKHKHGHSTSSHKSNESSHKSSHRKSSKESKSSSKEESKTKDKRSETHGQKTVSSSSSKSHKDKKTDEKHCKKYEKSKSSEGEKSRSSEGEKSKPSEGEKSKSSEGEKSKSSDGEKSKHRSKSSSDKVKDKEHIKSTDKKSKEKEKNHSSKENNKSSSSKESDKNYSRDNDKNHASKESDKNISSKESNQNNSNKESNKNCNRKDKKHSSDDCKKKHDRNKSSSSQLKRTKDHESSKKYNKEKEEIPPFPKRMKKLDPIEESQMDSYSDTSDIEEIFKEEEPIVIDSSSSSSIGQYAEYSQEIDSNDPWDSDAEIPDPSDMPLPKIFRNSSALQNTLCERWKKARETVSLRTSAPGKVKICQVPNVSSLLHAKHELISKTKIVNQPPKQNEAEFEEYIPTPIARKAHAPSQAFASYPVVIIEENLKVPVSIRQPCLNNIFDEYKKFCSPEVAKRRALDDELEICKRLHVSKTYQNAVALALLRIRKSRGLPSTGDQDKETKKKTRLTSDSITDFTYGWTLYQCFNKYVLSEEEYVSNGYPVPIPTQKGCGYIDKAARRNSIKNDLNDNLRTCLNCSKNYYVDEAGFPLKENDCFYHWGKLRRVRICGVYTQVYICCESESGSEPCTTGRYHITNLYNDDMLEGFVKTRPLSPNIPEDAAGIYAIDCEMCYTTKGLDLARCTIVDLNGEMIYDKVVLPDDPVLDYCTRFSGMTEDIMKSSRLKLKDIQRDLLGIINEKTILVGHSLENDMKALRIFHKTFVDTSVVFPHRMGFPYKIALKRLAKEILNINIQEKETGHDSKEDALTCLQIMMWKIKEDAKSRKPRVIISLDSKGGKTVTR